MFVELSESFFDMLTEQRVCRWRVLVITSYSIHYTKLYDNSVGTAQHQLASTDDEVVGQYKKQWRELGETFEAEMRRVLEELSLLAEGNT